MAFPSTGILDAFNRGNEGPPPSDDWTDVENGLEVIDNQCAGDNAASNFSYWDVETFGPACECYTTLADVGGVCYSFVSARLALPAFNGYLVQVNTTESPDEITIQRLDSGSGTQLGAAIEQALANGDKLGLECDGDQIAAYFDDGGAGWGLLGTRTDATYSDAGYVGAFILGQSDRLDDFGGGTIPPAVERIPRYGFTNFQVPGVV